MIGVGTDIVELSRIAAVLDRHGPRFIDRVLVPSEREQLLTRGDDVRFLAKRWAAKEAVAKALGTGIGGEVSFHDITVSNDARGAPRIALSGGAEQVAKRLEAHRMLISISDETHYVIAFAVLC